MTKDELIEVLLDLCRKALDLNTRQHDAMRRLVQESDELREQILVKNSDITMLSSEIERLDELYGHKRGEGT